MSLGTWHTRPLFISSTFRDMQAERDHLRDVVFPELARRLQERQGHLEPIDLRWGVETVTLAEQEKKELLVLKVCLDEIERSRPFLIAILGERYGWVPPPERMRAAVDEKGYDTEMAGKSVTALEIEYGVFANPAMQHRCFFYFREITNLDSLPRETAAFYSDHYSSDPQAVAAHARLTALKQRIKDDVTLAPRVRPYAVEWQDGRLLGLEAWGKQVLEDLWRELDQETRERAEKIDPTWQGEERRLLEEFIELRARDFAGRAETIEQLKELALSPRGRETWGICLHGPAGSGKSAVFARLRRELEDRDCLLLAHAAGISPRSTSLHALLRRWIQELAVYLKPEAADPSKGIETLEEKKKLFADLLSRAAVKTRVVCLIDALNQMERSIPVRYMNWLPELWPENARLIVTAIAGEETQSLAKRRGVRTSAIDALARNDAENIVRTICRRYRKGLHQEIIDELLGKELPDQTPAAGNPLWLHLAVEQLLLLDEDDFAEAEKLPGSADERIHGYMLRIAGSFPADVAGLYGVLLQRAHGQFGRRAGINWIPEMLDFLAASRYGLREADIKALVSHGSAKDFDLRFAVVRRYLRAHLVQRGEPGLWDFTHQQLRLCLQKDRLANQEQYRNCHLQLALHLEKLDRADPLRITERMYHLLAGDLKQQAAAYYGGDLSDIEEKSATAVLAEAVLAGEGPVENRGITWLRDLLRLDTENWNGAGFLHGICRRINFSLLPALADASRVQTRIAVAGQGMDYLEELRKRAPDSADYIIDLSVSYELMGDLNRELGEPSNALEYYKKALNVREKIRGPTHEDPFIAKGLSLSYEKLGNIYRELGKPSNALEYYQKALDVREKFSNPTSDDIDSFSRGLVSSYERMGNLYLDELGEPSRAKQFFKKCLTIVEKLHDTARDNADFASNLTVIYQRMGELYEKLSNLTQALEYHKKALALAEELHHRIPDKADYAINLSISYDKLGFLYRHLGEPVHAKHYYQKALAIAEELCDFSPDSAKFNYNLFTIFHGMGDLYLHVGESSRAKEYFKKALAIAKEACGRAPENIVFTHSLSGTYSSLGDLYLELGEPPRAKEYFKKALAIAEKLYDFTSHSTKFASSLSSRYEDLGKLYYHQGELLRAKEFYQKALAIAGKLHALVPDNAEFFSTLSDKYNNLGDLFSQLGEPLHAREYYEKAIEVREKIHSQSPDNPEFTRALSINYNKLGSFYRLFGEPTCALEYFQKSLKLLEEIQNIASCRADFTRDLSVAHYQLGHFLQEIGDLEQRNFHFIACRDLLLMMKSKEMHFDGQMEVVLKNLISVFPIQQKIVEEIVRVASKNHTLGITTDVIVNGLFRTKDILNTYVSKGDQAISFNEPQYALEFYKKALEISAKLCVDEPDNIVSAKDLLSVYGRLGNVFLKLGESSNALKYFQKGLIIGKELRKNAPDRTDFLEDLAVTYFKVGQLFEEQNNKFEKNFHLSICLQLLLEMKKKGLSLDEQMENVLNILKSGFRYNEGKEKAGEWGKPQVTFLTENNEKKY